jgi:multidrug efflux pump subunit AcrB
MKISSILNKVVKVVTFPLSGPAKLLLTPLENKMNAAVKAAAVSMFRKILRTLLAVGATALLAALPAMQAVFEQAAAKGGMTEQIVFGGIVAGLVGIIAFLERYVAMNGKPQA